MIKKLLPKNNQVAQTSLLLLYFALLMTACGKDQEQTSVPPKPPVQMPKAAVAQGKPVQTQVSSSLRIIPSSVNEFDFSTKKDPFKPFVAVKTETRNSPELNKRTLHDSLPIHSYDVSQFKLIGIITGGRESKAMVTDPGGKGYVLKVGMLIGKNDGRIVSINLSGVEVLEQFKDDNGRVRKEHIKLSLPRKQ